MTDSLAIVEAEEDAGYRFSWGLPFVGGIAAVAVTFFLLTLGAGFGLLLAHPVTQSTRALPAFLTGGAIYFFVAQAFGFAVGVHLTGRLLGPQIESRAEEDFRAAAHGLLAWAIAVVLTLLVVTFAGLAASGGATAALYGASRSAGATDAAGTTGYLVDKLFRPEGGVGRANEAYDHARAEAARILEAGMARGEEIAPDDRTRLTQLVSAESGLSPEAASDRIAALQNDVQDKTRKAADVARRAASYVSLWIAFSLLFGAIVAIGSAIFAREQDDRRMLTR